MNARRALRGVRAPDEPGAQQRAWPVVRSAYLESAPAPAPRSRWRVAAVPVVAAVLAGVLLSPAGATVGRWIRHTFGFPHAQPTLQSLPAPGRLLISGPGGAWTIAADGSMRRLGSWHQASWSPRGLYVLVAGASGVAALDPHGTTHWLLARPAVRDPRWYGPSGYRVAYLSNGVLRVAAGDGTGDHALARDVAPVAPAWEPGHPYRIAYASRDGRLLVRDADSGALAWSATLPPRPRELAWSADGARLVVSGGAFVRLYDAAGKLLRTARLGPIHDVALSPDGRTLAVLSGGAQDDVGLLDLTRGGSVPRRLMSGAGLEQVAWSPNGRWLLVSWPRADQWVFVRVAGRPRIAAFSHIAQDFGSAGFPRIDGWCCTVAGSGG